ncbi:MAG: bifunctional DedA family/phosphatase PAP2 family protein, partial [Actinomycetota bacterium]|nr:bifunctional DedA family/phosphatase PAP2 family protein [Actinomycetota bacterium]
AGTVSDLLDSLGSLAGPSAYLVVAILAALEASAFVGLFVPGELAMLVGGYIAFREQADLVTMMVFAAMGAVVGDSLGYELGRRLGPSIRGSRLGRRVGEERWARAEHYLATKGGRAVFFGRFIGVLRALVPALAGVSRMPYRRFLFWNALGGMIWAPSIVGLGYLAGRSYRRVEHYAGRVGLVLLVFFALVAAVAAVGRWVANHPAEVRAFGRRMLAVPFVATVHRRYRAQLVFVARRLTPGRALGLALTLQLVALGLAGWAFGSVVQDVITGDGAARVDAQITRELIEHRVGWLTSTMEAVTDLGHIGVLVFAVLSAGVIVQRLARNWLPLLILALALLGAIALTDVVKPLVGRVRPDMGPLVAADGFAFPSGHATESVAVYGGLAYLAAGWFRTWKAKVATWTVALLVVLLVGFSRVYLGLHWTTDVLGGYALGAVWLAAVLVTTSAIRGAWNRRRPLDEAVAPPAEPPVRVPGD